MALSNQELLLKADQRVADLSAGGLKTPEQMARFYRVAFQKRKLMQLVTIREMKAPELRLPNARMNGTVLQPRTEGIALPENARSKLTMGGAVLTTVSLMGEVHYSDELLEDNVESADFENTLLDEVAVHVGTDLEKLAIRGDTSIVIPDPQVVGEEAWKLARLLKQQDGLIKQQTSYTLNAGGVRLNKNVLKAAWQTLPVEFRSGDVQLFTHENAVADYWDSIANRQTPAGDAAYQASGDTSWQGKKIVGIPLWPEGLGTDENMTVVTAMNPRNLHVGFVRNVKFERVREARAGDNVFLWTVRVGVKFQYEPETLKITNVLVTPDN